MAMQPPTQPEPDDDDQGGPPDGDADDQGTSSPDKGGGTESDQTPNVSAADQQMYDKVVTFAMSYLYSKQGFSQTVLKLVQMRQNMVMAIGHTALMLVLSARNTADQQGTNIDDGILYHASHEVIGMLCEIAVGTKLIKQQQVPAIANAALYQGVKLWGMQAQKNNEIDPNDQKTGQQQLAKYHINPQAGAGLNAPMHSQPSSGMAPPMAGAPQPAGAPPGPGIVNQGMGAQ